jgi:hypothetical protein
MSKQLADIDKDFWITIRAALIMFIRAIEKRYDLKTHEFSAKSDCEIHV